MVDDSISHVITQWGQLWPGLDVSPIGVIARMARIRALIETEQAQLFAEAGITAADFPVLVTLRRTPAPHRLTHGHLAERLGLTPGSITVRVEHLVRAGLITRTADQADARVRWAQLTDRGLSLINDLIPTHLQLEEELLSGIDSPRRQRLAEDLAALLSSLESRTRDPRPTWQA